MRRLSFPLLIVLALAMGATGVLAHNAGLQGPASPPQQIAPATIVDPTLGQCFTATLEGQQEVPAVTSPAKGVATFVMSPDKISFTYYITYTGLTSTETMAHFHKAPKGVSGGVVYALSNSAPKEGMQSLTAADVADIEAGRWYVNVHTSNFPSGEIRGQILPGNECYTASLSGAAEVPPNTSAGKGAGTFALAPDRRLVYDIGFTGMTERVSNGAHIHKGILGIAGSVVFPLPAGIAKRGNITLTSDQLAELRSNQYYVNIHSETFPNGEIRGQIFPASNCFTATLSGSNEIPQNTSTASGMGMFTLTNTLSGTETLNTLRYTIRSTGILTPTVQHVHRGGPLVAGDVVFALPAGEPKIGSGTLNTDDLGLLRGAMLYANLHSQTYPGGEIRGQLIPTLCGVNLPLVVR